MLRKQTKKILVVMLFALTLVLAGRVDLRIAAVISFAKRRMMNHLPRLQPIFRGWMVGKPMNCMAETGLLI